MEGNWAASRVRRNFRIDLFSAVLSGLYISVLVTFMPVVVRRLGGSASDVALVIAAPFVGHLLAPVFAYLLAGIPVVRVVAGTTTVARVVLIVGVLVAATPLMLAVTTVVFFVITVANVAAYTALMQGIYPDRERAQAMANVRVGASIAGIASAALAGAFIDIIPAAYVFAAATALALPGAVAFFWVRYQDPPVPAQRRSAAVIARDVWSDRRYRRLLFAFTVFGFGNLMNAAIYPIMLVDHFDAPNTWVGALYAVQCATMILAYLIWGRVIDRGSSLRLSLLNTVLVVLVPVGYLVAPSIWALLPVAVVTGITVAGGEITFYTNVVQLAPRERVAEYAAAQSLLLGLRGTAAPFIASGLLASVEPKAVLVTGMFFMVAGCAIFAGALRQPKAAVAPILTPATRTAETAP
jgi:MFS family permease